MNDLLIEPLGISCQAEVSVPGSKSITNRALLLAALADGRTRLENALFSDDSLYMMAALEKLGFELHADPTAATIEITGCAGKIPSQTASLYIGNAGTAARFLAAMLSLGKGSYILDGDQRMRQRPFQDLAQALRQLGADLTTSPAGTLPAAFTSTGLRGGSAQISGHITSQFLSALLMAAPLARQAVRLILTTPLASLPYVHMTLRMMAQFGHRVDWDGGAEINIEPGRYRSPGSYTVEPDASGASYFFAIPAVCGGDILVRDAGLDSLQGDIGFVRLLEQMGCRVEQRREGLWVKAPDSQLRGLDIDMRDISDTAQTLAVIAPFARDLVRIRGIASSRGKETDRVTAVCKELARLGVRVEEKPDGMIIHPAGRLSPARVRTYNDHRMAMAFTITGLRNPGIHIENPDCVSKTFPTFFDVIDTVRRQSRKAAA